MSTAPQPCPLSEYTKSFKLYKGAKRRESFKPALKALTQDARMDGLTTSRKDYVPHPITPPPPKTPVVYVRPEGTVDGTSEYKKQFVGRWAAPTKAITPVMSRKQDSGTFDHKSSHFVDYQAPPPVPRELYRQTRTYTPPKEPFDGRTTVQSDYITFGTTEPTRSLKPPVETKLSTEPFEASTSYQLSYTPRAIPARFHRPTQTYTPSKEKFSGSTTFRSDFPGHEGIPPAQSLRPSQAPRLSDSPFDGNTVSRQSYRSWQLPKRHSRPPTVYAPPTQKFLARSTFKSDYPDHGVVPIAVSMKPHPPERKDTSQFVGLTTQRNDYQIWSNVERPATIRREKKYEPPQECFEGVSTFREHYQGRFAPRSPSAKPPISLSNNLIAAEPAEHLENQTAYRESFSLSGYQPCPALYLSEKARPSTQFSFSHRDPSSGHMFYCETQPDTDIAAV